MSLEPRLPQHFHENQSIYLREFGFLIREVEPDHLSLVLELESEMVLSRNRKNSLDVCESNFSSGLLYCEEVHCVDIIVILWDVVEYVSYCHYSFNYNPLVLI